MLQDLSTGARELGPTIYKVPKIQESLDSVRQSALRQIQNERYKMSLDYHYPHVSNELMARPTFAEISSSIWDILEESSKADYKR